MAESVEELAVIIKDYAKKHRKLHDRIADLESKAGLKAKQASERNPPAKQGSAQRKSPHIAQVKAELHSPPVKDPKKATPSRGSTRKSENKENKRDSTNLTTTTHTK